MSTNVSAWLAAFDIGDLFEMFIALVVILGGLLTGVIRHFRGEREVPVEVDEEVPRPERSTPKQVPSPQRPPAAPRRPRPVEFPGTGDSTFGPVRPRKEPAPPKKERRPVRAPRKEPVTVARGIQEQTAAAGPTAAPTLRPLPTASTTAEAARQRGRFALVHQPTRSTLRYAIVMSEVLGPPVALRPMSGE
jgi:hypothetical protein